MKRTENTEWRGNKSAIIRKGPHCWKCIGYRTRDILFRCICKGMQPLVASSFILFLCPESPPRKPGNERLETLVHGFGFSQSGLARQFQHVGIELCGHCCRRRCCDNAITRERQYYDNAVVSLFFLVVISPATNSGVEDEVASLGD